MAIDIAMVIDMAMTMDMAMAIDEIADLPKNHSCRELISLLFINPASWLPHANKEFYYYYKMVLFPKQFIKKFKLIIIFTFYLRLGLNLVGINIFCFILNIY